MQRSLDVLCGFGVDIWMFNRNQWLMCSPDGEGVAQATHIIRDEPTIVADFAPYLAQTCKIVAASSDAPLLGRCEAAMHEAVGSVAITVRSDNYYLDLTAPGYNKGTFVIATARRLGVATEGVATIGDMQNDLSMFATSGISFAMGNASDAVKQHAKYVTAINRTTVLLRRSR